LIAFNRDECAEVPQDVEDFWACPRCGGSDWRVADSRFDGVQRKRQRVCRKCNTYLPTIELPQPLGFRVVIIATVEEPQ
jgi:transcriptional regulator NrdR family protein